MMKAIFSIVLISIFQQIAAAQILMTTESGSVNPELQSLLYFERIDLTKITFKGKELAGSDYQITVKEFKNGKNVKTDVVFNSREDAYFKIKDDPFQFRVLTKVTEGSEFKIQFLFNGFNVGRKYKVAPKNKDSFALKDFLGSESAVNIDPKQKFYLLAFMTPYRRQDGSTTYCEVAQSGTDPEKLGTTFAIPHYFLVEMSFNK